MSGLPKREGSVYDAVAGRIGPNGFLTKAQQRSSNVKSLAPEKVLENRAGAEESGVLDHYDADERLPDPDHTLPESDLVKAIHTYASDFFASATIDQGRYDYRSMDETALLAMGVLLEEAAKEILGENGDMVLLEPDGLESELPENRMVQHQVRGKVKPPPTPEFVSEEESEEEIVEERPRKRRSRFKTGLDEDDWRG